MAGSLRSLRQVATLMHDHMARRSTSAFRALGGCVSIADYVHFLQNWIVVINQRFLKTLLHLSCAPSSGGRQKNPTNIGNIVVVVVIGFNLPLGEFNHGDTD